MPAWIGKGAKKISISLESDLLRAADAFARKKGVNRWELIAHFVLVGLRRRAG
jgi:metal-responsive CopG/Arc/MetJ family transcriptional regulator